MMKFRGLIAAAVLIVGLLMVSVSNAKAASLSALYSFAQVNKDAHEFHYHDGGGPFGLGSFDVGVAAPTVVSFQGLGGGLPTGNFFLTMTGHAEVTASSPPGVQPWVVDKFWFGTAPGLGDVLMVDTTAIPVFPPFTPPSFNTILQGTSATTAAFGVTDVGPPTQVITFTSSKTSEPLNGNPPGYPGVPARDWSNTLTGINNVNLAVDPVTNSFFSFDAIISGNADFTPTVPEPSALAMLIGLGIGGSLFGFKLRRRT